MNKFFRIRQLWLLIQAHFHEIIREPGVIFWGIIFPILMSLGLGLAFTRKADVARKVAVIQTSETSAADTSAISRFLGSRCEQHQPSGKNDYRWKIEIRDNKLGKSTYFFYEVGWDDALVLLKKGTVNLIIDSSNGETVYNFDPVNSDAELTYLKLSAMIGPGNVLPAPAGDEIRPLTLAGTRYIDFLIPGLITLGIMMSSMWGISYGIIEKRSKKLLRRMVATPMKKSHFLIALIAVRVIMNFIEALAVFLFAIVAFKVTIQGSISALILLFFAGNIAFAGLAVLISSHTSNTEVGNGLINAVVMPMMVLSGIFFSYHNFPDWSLPVIRNLPLTMLADGMRGIFNEGAGWSQTALPVVILSTIGVVCFGTGLKIFKWH
jgi:ABC-2 type transport system permease protein